MITTDQITQLFSQMFADETEMAAWLQLLDRDYRAKIMTANARVARQEAASMTQQAEATAQQAETAARTAQAEFDALAAALAQA